MESNKLEVGTYELLEATLKNTVEELNEIKSRLRHCESEKYDLSLEVMQLKLELNLNSNKELK